MPSSTVAISRVKKLSGLWFKTSFPIGLLKKPQGTSGDLDTDTGHHQNLQLGPLPHVDLIAYHVQHLYTKNPFITKEVGFDVERKLGLRELCQLFDGIPCCSAVHSGHQGIFRSGISPAYVLTRSNFSYISQTSKNSKN